MTSARTSVLFLFALVAGPACHHHKGGDQPTPDTPPVDVPLEVDNHNWLDMVIYVIHDGERTRVGTASASSQTSFTLPARLVGQSHEVRLMGHPIGGEGAALTETVTVQPGQYIAWTLETDLDRSSIGVY